VRDLEAGPPRPVTKSSFRPGISYTRYLDKPLTSKDDNILQLDLPFSF
jgi:hypothetical protein